MLQAYIRTGNEETMRVFSPRYITVALTVQGLIKRRTCSRDGGEAAAETKTAADRRSSQEGFLGGFAMS